MFKVKKEKKNENKQKNMSIALELVNLFSVDSSKDTLIMTKGVFLSNTYDEFFLRKELADVNR